MRRALLGQATSESAVFSDARSAWVSSDQIRRAKVWAKVLGLQATLPALLTAGQSEAWSSPRVQGKVGQARRRVRTRLCLGGVCRGPKLLSSFRQNATPLPVDLTPCLVS